MQMIMPVIQSFSPDKNNIKQNIENDIGKIKTWKEENQVKMRCQDWIYSLRNSRQPQEEHNHSLDLKIKFLGIHLDEKLSLKDHIPNR